MLRPQDNAARETKKLDGLWDFALDAAGTGRTEAWWSGPLPSPKKLPVPASYNDLLLDTGVRDHVGDVWYQRTVVVPRGWSDQRVVLRFDAATHRATVWVDERMVIEHEGGYTPFEADITDVVRPGAAMRITVVVNNELTWESIPPGVVDESRGRRQRYYHDFFNYSGLHRSVWLYSTPVVHIADVTVVTDVEESTGIVRCATTVRGDEDARVHVLLRDGAGATVGQADGDEAVIRVPDAELWHPGRGCLYELEVVATGSDGAQDRYTLPVGIRTVRVDGTRFLINEQPFYFRGFGMHEDHDVRGKGHDDASMVHDFELLQWTGANSFRTSHYPYAEEVLEHADRLGIVVIAETAAVGLNLAHGGGFYLGGQRVTFSEETLSKRTQEVHRRAIEELIARDKNHPSIVLWSIANEPESNTEEAREYFAPLFDTAHTADPTRPAGFVNVMATSAEQCLVSELADVVMLNRYYGWYDEAGDLVSAANKLEADLQAWSARFEKPIIITEYGADAVSGLRSIREAPWSEDYQCAFLEAYHEVFDRVDAVVGEHVWNFADFATSDSFIRVDGNKKGVFTRDRRPKAAAYALRRRWRAGT